MSSWVMWPDEVIPAVVPASDAVVAVDEVVLIVNADVGAPVTVVAIFNAAALARLSQLALLLLLLL